MGNFLSEPKPKAKQFRYILVHMAGTPQEAIHYTGTWKSKSAEWVFKEGQLFLKSFPKIYSHCIVQIESRDIP